MYKEKSLEDFIEDLSEKKPTPGGGGAAALTLSSGAALISMVANFSKGKKSSPAGEEDYQRIIEKSQSLAKDLLNRVDEDAEKYGQLSKSYKIKKEDEKRQEKIRQALRESAMTPLSCLKLANEALILLDQLLPISSKNMVSDVLVSAKLFEGGIASSFSMVKANTDFMGKDGDPIIKEAEELKKQGLKMAKSIYDRAEELTGRS